MKKILLASVFLLATVNGSKSALAGSYKYQDVMCGITDSFEKVCLFALKNENEIRLFIAHKSYGFSYLQSDSNFLYSKLADFNFGTVQIGEKKVEQGMNGQLMYIAKSFYFEHGGIGELLIYAEAESTNSDRSFKVRYSPNYNSLTEGGFAGGFSFFNARRVKNDCSPATVMDRFFKADETHPDKIFDESNSKALFIGNCFEK